MSTKADHIASAQPGGGLIGLFVGKFGQAAFGVVALVVIVQFAVIPLMDRINNASAVAAQVVETGRDVIKQGRLMVEAQQHMTDQFERIANKIDQAATRLGKQLTGEPHP